MMRLVNHWKYRINNLPDIGYITLGALMMYGAPGQEIGERRLQMLYHHGHHKGLVVERHDIILNMADSTAHISSIHTISAA
ncbi:unnamed protein product [Rhodiola kirilowii]